MALNPDLAMQFLTTLGVIGLILQRRNFLTSHGNCSTEKYLLVCNIYKPSYIAINTTMSLDIVGACQLEFC